MASTQDMVTQRDKYYRRMMEAQGDCNLLNTQCLHLYDKAAVAHMTLEEVGAYAGDLEKKLDLAINHPEVDVPLPKVDYTSNVTLEWKDRNNTIDRYLSGYTNFVREVYARKQEKIQKTKKKK
jgi:hypothetical protein